MCILNFSFCVLHSHTLVFKVGEVSLVMDMLVNPYPTNVENRVSS